jgi:uncharacterized membrane protein YGL010W
MSLKDNNFAFNLIPSTSSDLETVVENNNHTYFLIAVIILFIIYKYFKYRKEKFIDKKVNSLGFSTQFNLHTDRFEKPMQARNWQAIQKANAVRDHKNERLRNSINSNF